MLVIDTVGANVLVARAMIAGITARAITGMKALVARVARPGVTTLLSLAVTVGAKDEVVSARVDGVTVTFVDGATLKLSNLVVVPDSSLLYVPVVRHGYMVLTPIGLVALVKLFQVEPSLETSQYVVPLASRILNHACVVALYVVNVRTVEVPFTFL